MNKNHPNNKLQNILDNYAIWLMIVGCIVLFAAYYVLFSQTTHVNAAYVPSEVNETIAPAINEIEATPCENIVLTDDLIPYTDDVYEFTDIIPVEKPAINTMIDLEKYTSIFNWQSYNKNSNFGVDQLYTLHEYCEKHEVPIELMLSIISYESSFVSTAISDESTASGYCQIVKKTAEYVYEEILEYGEYDIENHETIMINNWELNLEIGCALMKYNCDQNWGSWEYAIHDYHGNSDESENAEYFQYINTRLYKLFNINVCDIK